MSGRSKTLARYIRKERAGGPEQGQSHDTLLDKGFSLLKDELAREFHNQIKEVNHEPGCIDALGSAFGDTEGRVFKLGEETKGLAISFNTAARISEIKGKEPLNFCFFIKVRLSKDETKWCYAGGESKEDLVPLSGKLDAAVEKALFALYGVDT
jgi:hypothetical protein